MFDLFADTTLNLDKITISLGHHYAEAPLDLQDFTGADRAKVFSVGWGGWPAFFDVFTGKDGKMERSGREYD